MTNRNLKVDSLKGFLILLVVLGHLPFSHFNIEKSLIIKNIGMMIYFFHMPLFFAISTLFIKKNYEWLIKRAFVILLPYLFWYFYGHKRLLLENPLNFLSDLLMGNWTSLNSILWFLPALYSLNILFFIFERLKIKGRALMIILSVLAFIFSEEIMSIHQNVPFGFDVALYLFLLVFVIRLIYLNRLYFEQCHYLAIILLLTLSSVLLFYFEPIKTHTEYQSIIDLAQFSVPVTVFGYVSYTILSCTIFILFLRLKGNKILAYIGYYSFPIFLLHLIVIYKTSTLIQFDEIIYKVICLLI